MSINPFLKKTFFWTAVFFSLFCFSSQSTVFAEPIQNQKIKTMGQKNQKVKAGWYGPGHHNKLTANGQRFNMYKNTMAHKTLPLGTKVQLYTLDKKKSVVGVVNDRGPYVKGRDLDVSYAIARQLGFVRKGVTELYLCMLEENQAANN
ncbi:MAG: septal ring lytic transglycosylase RlpA family protein [Thermodesulfobacteriota bacterium]